MRLEDVMAHVIKAKNFRNDVLLSEVLEQPCSAGMIVRREHEEMCPDIFEPGASFIVDTYDQRAKMRRLCFKVENVHKALTGTREAHIPKHIADEPMAWCYATINNEPHWIQFSFALRVSSMKNIFAKPKYTSHGPSFMFPLKSRKRISLPVKTAHAAFAALLNGNCRCGPVSWGSDEYMAIMIIAHNYFSHNAKHDAKHVIAEANATISSNASVPVDCKLGRCITPVGMDAPGKAVHVWRRVLWYVLHGGD